MDIDTVCKLLISALEDAGYNASTIFNYQGAVRRFKAFCEERNITKYSSDVGELYANDVISPKTGKFSKERYHLQGRFIRLIDSYINTGKFDFAVSARTRLQPDNAYHRSVYNEFCAYLKDEYDNENTQHFYDYGMYSFLTFLESNYNALRMEDITAPIVLAYLKNTKPTRQREVLCEIRKICRYLGRNDLLLALAGIHAPRYNRIIPVLESDEQERIKVVTEDKNTPLRDTAMILLGLSTGIRACDIINLRLSDIDWRNDTISWRQSKTGNLVCVPLTPSVGNAIARYLVEQRPNAPNDYLFVRLLAPFDRLSCHSSCYVMVKRILEKASVQKNGRILGMHMLRHNAASTMVRNEVPIETIAAILGHSDPDTTGIYITTDQERLKECVLPFGSISKEVIP
jgi:integrase